MDYSSRDEMGDTHKFDTCCDTEDYGGDRRRATRRRVLLGGQIFPIAQSGDACTVNLSRSGLMAEATIPLKAGQLIFIAFDDNMHAAARVRWTEDHRFGAEFESPILVMPDAIDTEDESRFMPRLRRVPIALDVRVYLCDEARIARIRNISKTGLMLEGIERCMVEQQLLVKFATGHSAVATVKWACEERVGAAFHKPIGISQFGCSDGV